MFFDYLSKNIRRKLDSFEESGMGYWRVKVTLNDGRRYSNVFLLNNYTFGSPNMPFKLSDIVTVEWEGFTGKHNDGIPREIEKSEKDFSNLANKDEATCPKSAAKCDED